LERDCDVLVCGASFAGLAIARELAGSGARVLMIDRYEIGERQTSACAMPTRWLNAMELQASHRQTFDEIVVHSPFHTSRWSLPWSFSTFDYRELCALMWEQADDGELEFQTATVTSREGDTVQTDRGPLTAPLIVDGLGWRRVLSHQMKIQPPNAPMSRGLEVHPAGRGEELELWIDPRYIRCGYSWSFPAEDELRVGVGSFRPADHVKQPTLRLAGDLGLPADRYQGNWIPHKLRTAVEDGVFFVGDSAGHCLPLTAEGIRTALYFGLACGRELRAVVDGRSTRERALKRYGAFSAAHAKKFAWMLRAQQAAGFTTPSRSLATVIRCFENRRLCGWVFDRYLEIAPPAFVADGARALTRSRLAAVSA
jgi:digeranylgeranylglycerophospholipid reductase